MIFLTLVAIVLGYVLIKLFNAMFYWRRKQVFHLSLWKHAYRVFLSDTSFAEASRELYEAHPEKRFIGSYQFSRPSLFVRDLELIKKITIKDFDHFTDHMTFNSNRNVLSYSLFALRGKKWHQLRTTMSPTFTSSKMRQLFALIANNAQIFTKHFENVLMKDNKDSLLLEMDKNFSKFTNDVIASCAFGIRVDSLGDPDNEFMRMGGKFLKPTRKGLLGRMFPRLFELLGIQLTDKKAIRFFQKLIKDTIQMRKIHSIIRPDIIHLLLEARKGVEETNNDEKHVEDTGYATVQESLPSANSNDRALALTDDVITAQALIFFIAGFTTSSGLMAFLAYELALNVNVQKRLQVEIDDYHRRHNGELIYDELMKLKYLDQVVCEGLRKWPPGFTLNRECTKDYHIPKVSGDDHPEEPSQGVLVEKGSIVTIPVFGIHRDPQIFAEPDRFDPDRFSEENKRHIIAGSYMPFGAGPRNCIASRFALLEIKTLMVALLHKFEFECSARTQVPVVLAKAVSIQAKQGIWLNLKKRNNAHVE